MELYLLQQVVSQDDGPEVLQPIVSPVHARWLGGLSVHCRPPDLAGLQSSGQTSISLSYVNNYSKLSLYKVTDKTYILKLCRLRM